MASKTEDTDMNTLNLKIDSTLHLSLLVFTCLHLSSLVFSLLYFSFASDELLLIKFNQQVMESMNWSNALMW